MKPFRHIDAESIDHALAILTRYSKKAAVIAGGTDLLGVLKSEILPDYPKVIINLKTIPGMDTIKTVEKDCRIGATARLADIAASDIIKKSFPALAAAAESVGSPELRNMGTLGGNLCQDTRCWYYRYPDKMGGAIPCHRKGNGPCPAVKGENRYHAILGAKKCFAVCPSDTATALAALDARIKMIGPQKERMIPILDFFNTPDTGLKPDEVVTEIRIPVPKKNMTQVFYKNRVRNALDFAVASIAVRLEKTGRVCTDARIILGAVAPGPFRAVFAEAAIKGRPVNQIHASMAAEAAAKGARPLSQNAYKIDIVKALVKQALLTS